MLKVKSQKSKVSRGEIATLLTLGLVIVGAVITLASSFFINQRKNLSSNPKAATSILCCKLYDCGLYGAPAGQRKVTVIGFEGVDSQGNVGYTNCLTSTGYTNVHYCSEIPGAPTTNGASGYVSYGCTSPSTPTPAANNPTPTTAITDYTCFNTSGQDCYSTCPTGYCRVSGTCPSDNTYCCGPCSPTPTPTYYPNQPTFTPAPTATKTPTPIKSPTPTLTIIPTPTTAVTGECNNFTCPSNNSIKYSYKCVNPGFGMCGGSWNFYTGSGCSGAPSTFSSLESMQSNISSYCMSSLRNIHLSIILKATKPIPFEPTKPKATFKICFVTVVFDDMGSPQTSTVCPVNKSFNLTEIDANGYNINENIKGPHELTWTLTFNPVGIDWQDTLSGSLIESNGQISGEVMINKYE